MAKKKRKRDRDRDRKRKLLLSPTTPEDVLRAIVEDGIAKVQAMRDAKDPDWRLAFRVPIETNVVHDWRLDRRSGRGE